MYTCLLQQSNASKDESNVFRIPSIPLRAQEGLESCIIHLLLEGLRD